MAAQTNLTCIVSECRAAKKLFSGHHVSHLAHGAQNSRQLLNELQYIRPLSSNANLAMNEPSHYHSPSSRDVPLLACILNSDLGSKNVPSRSSASKRARGVYNTFDSMEPTRLNVIIPQSSETETATAVNGGAQNERNGSKRRRFRARGVIVGAVRIQTNFFKTRPHASIPDL